MVIQSSSPYIEGIIHCKVDLQQNVVLAVSWDFLLYTVLPALEMEILQFPQNYLIPRLCNLEVHVYADKKEH